MSHSLNDVSDLILLDMIWYGAFAIRRLPMRLHFLSLLAVTLLASSIARADVIYDITLTSVDGYAGGSGSFALNLAPPSSGIVTYGFPGHRTYTPGYIVDSFTLLYVAPAQNVVISADTYSYIRFTDGALSSLSDLVFYGGTASCPSQLSVTLTGYGYGENCELDYGHPTFFSDTGTVTITPEIATTPESTSFALLATGLVSVAGLVRKRYTRAHTF